MCEFMCAKYFLMFVFVRVYSLKIVIVCEYDE